MQTLLLLAQVAAANLLPRPTPDQPASYARWLVHESDYGVVSTHHGDAVFGNVISTADGGGSEHSTGVIYAYIPKHDETVKDVAKNSSVTITWSEFALRSGTSVGCFSSTPENPPCGRVTIAGKLVKVPNANKTTALEYLFATHANVMSLSFSTELEPYWLDPASMSDVVVSNMFGGARSITKEKYFAALWYRPASAGEDIEMNEDQKQERRWRRPVYDVQCCLPEFDDVDKTLSDAQCVRCRMPAGYIMQCTKTLGYWIGNIANVMVFVVSLYTSIVGLAYLSVVFFEPDAVPDWPWDWILKLYNREPQVRGDQVATRHAQTAAAASTRERASADARVDAGPQVRGDQVATRYAQTAAAATTSERASAEARVDAGPQVPGDQIETRDAQSAAAASTSAHASADAGEDAGPQVMHPDPPIRQSAFRSLGGCLRPCFAVLSFEAWPRR